MEGLRRLGLWGIPSQQKFIPEVYVTASRGVRLELLSGLMDTDGWVEKWGSARFCSTSERLARDVADLVRSLGGWCSVRARRTTYAYGGTTKTGRPAFVCNIHHPEPKTMFQLTVKRARALTAPRRRRRPVFATVERVRTAEAQCIAVTHPSGLYITDEYVVTHNTAFALNIAQHVGVNLRGNVLVLSLEMSAPQLVQRMLCSEAKVDSQAVRTGYLSAADWARLTSAAGRLSEAKIFIDDSPALTVLEARAKARRMKAEHGLNLLVIDYLQLMRGRSNMENRQQEISEISRSLKALAKEINIPVVALSQLSRAVEARSTRDFRPQLSDLRECVTGETLVILADGRRVPIRSLVGTAPEVLAVSPMGKIVAAKSERVWRVGTWPVVSVRLASGRTIRATARHRLLSGGGWHRIDELRVADRLAIARRLPEPLFPQEWPDRRVALLGQLIGDGSEKSLPEAAFTLPNRQIALLLRHLWAPDGTIAPRNIGRGSDAVAYGTNSSGLASDVAALLLRLGIVARISCARKAAYRPGFFVTVSGALDQRRFLDTVGALGPREAPARRLAALLADRQANTNVARAASDICWDRIVAIEPAGMEDVFDLTVPGPASWLADGIVSHNSGALEQDADLILFLYRRKLYQEDLPPDEENVAEVIIGKQRNGPIGTVKVVFLPQYARFENVADSHRQPQPSF
jgi:replicative DNA helicase